MGMAHNCKTELALYSRLWKSLRLIVSNEYPDLSIIDFRCVPLWKKKLGKFWAELEPFALANGEPNAYF